MADKIFNAGDFLKRDSKRGSFMIYEGENISDSSYKKMTLLCYFDPEKYMMTPMGYHQVPNLEVSKRGKRCSETIDTEKEDYWVKVCSPKEKEEALKVLEEYGYEWNEELMALIDIATGAVVCKITKPDNTYYGQIIRPISEAFKALLKKFCLDKNSPAIPVHYGTSCYDDYYDGYD